MSPAQRKSNAARQARFKAARKADGMERFSVWLPRAAIPEFRALIEMLTADSNLRVTSVSVQDTATGRMRGVKLG